MENKTTIRYAMDKDAKYLYPTPIAKCIDSTPLPYDGIVYIDILEYDHERLYKVRAFFPDGSIHHGFVMKDYVHIEGKDNLFDGRFNSDKTQ